MEIPIPEWHGDVGELRALQEQLAPRIVLRDDYRKPLRTVAGFDVGYEDGGATTRAAAVLLDAGTLAVLDSQIARLPTRMPYIPGLLAFRELPALLAVLAQLASRPDLALVDGHGFAHPRRFGIASFFGLAADLPTIGIAKRILVGEPRLALHAMRGAFTPLRDGAQQIGWQLRSKVGCNPLTVSPGHRVAMVSAPELAMRFTTRYRLPEPTRLADHLASSHERQLPTTATGVHSSSMLHPHVNP